MMEDIDQRNKELDKKIEHTDLPDAVQVLIKDAKRRRHQLLALTVSLILDFLLTIGLFAVSVKTQQVAGQADSNHQAIVRSCEASNEARANNKALWDYILELPPNPTQGPLSADQQKQREDFKIFVAKTFAARDCSAIKE